MIRVKDHHLANGNCTMMVVADARHTGEKFDKCKSRFNI